MLEVRKAIRHGTMAYDWQERINFPRMRRERLERARAIMKQFDMAAMVLAKGENKRYTTAVRGATHSGPGDSFAIIFAEDPDPIVYEAGSIWICEKEHNTWLKPENFRPIGGCEGGAIGPEAMADHQKNAIALNIYNDLKQRGLLKEKLGVDFLAPEARAVLNDKGVTIVDANHAIMEARCVKTIDEIYCMKMAGAIVDIAYAEIIEKLRPGLRENEVAAIAHAALWKNGVDGVGGVTPRSGPNSAPNYPGRMPTDRIIQPGDLMFMDIFGASYMGYRSCYYRTFKVGTRPTEKEKKWFKNCRDYLYNAVNALKDGVTSAEVAAKFPPASVWNQDEDYVTAFGNALGHGIGLGQYEYPIISRYQSLKFPQVIKKGMTIAMETWDGECDVENQWRGGCRLENVYLVTEKGCENLYALPDEEIIVPPHSVYN